MPSRSQKEARTMQAAKHNPEFARKMGIPQDVAAEFVAADKGRDLSKLPVKVKHK